MNQHHSKLSKVKVNGMSYWWINRKTAVYNRLVFNNKIIIKYAGWYNRDVHWGHYARWKKPTTKDCTCYNSIYIKGPE